METEPTKIGDIKLPPIFDGPPKPRPSTPRILPPEQQELFLRQCGRRGIDPRHATPWTTGLMALNLATPWGAVDQKLSALSGRGCLMILVGPKGTGKTQIAVNQACDIIAQVRRGVAGQWTEGRYHPAHDVPEDTWPRYTKACAIFEDVRASFQEDQSDSEKRIMASYRRPSLLIVDEAQERGNTDFEDRTLTRIVDDRYAQMLDTLLIANLRREDLVKNLGTSIISRMHECGEVFECDWPSFREGANVREVA